MSNNYQPVVAEAYVPPSYDNDSTANLPVAQVVKQIPATARVCVPPTDHSNVYVDDDDEDDDAYYYDGTVEVSLAPQQLRLGFARKTMGILCSQLLLTFGIIAVFALVEPVRDYIQDNSWIFYAAFAISITALIVLICCGNNARTFPNNYVLLGIFTAAEGVLLGVMSSYYKTDSILIAAGMTLGITFALMLFAMQTKIDFTGMGLYLYAALVCLMLFGFMSALFYRGGMGRILYAGIGAAIFSMYIVYDTQKIMGGKHRKYQFALDDYVFASLSLYLDIINLFIMLLSLVGNRR